MTPASRASPICRRAPSTSIFPTALAHPVPPKPIVPSVIVETRRPDLPNCRYSIHQTYYAACTAANKDGLAGTAQALVAAVRAEFGEDDELPDRAGGFGGAEALTFAPMTLLALCRQDERHSTLGHDPAPCLRGSDAVRRLAEQGQREVADGWIVTVEEPSDGVGVRHRGWGCPWTELSRRCHHPEQA